MINKNKLYSYFGGRVYLILVGLIVVVAAFLRLYKIHDFATFLGDQGRDALIMKNIVTLKNFPALGPITSVGSVYLGPLYFYLMAPWLLLTIFDPIGPSIGVAIISTLALIFQYLAVKKLMDRETALVSVVFSAYSNVLVEYSRFSWNPNLLAPISFSLIVALIRFKQTGRLIYSILLGALLSIAIQLHFLAVFLIPFVTIGFLIPKKSKKKSLQHLIKPVLAASAAFVALLAPYILFEIIHGFPNMQSVLRFAGENSTTQSQGFISEIHDTTISMLRFIFAMPNLPVWLATFTLLGLVALTIYSLRKKHVIGVFAGALLTLLIGISFYHGPKFAHYLGTTYIIFYVILSYLLVLLTKRLPQTLAVIAIAAILVTFIKLQAPKYTFLYNIPSRQIETARQVARAIYDLGPRIPYALTASPESYSDHSYRYFLDLWGKSPIAKEQDAYVPTHELFVICEKKCDPMGDPQWTIAHFNPTKIVAEKYIAGHYVYKLIK